MAVIAATSTKQNGPFTPTVTTLTAADTLVYLPSRHQLLELRNTTGTPVVVTIDGDGGTTISPAGYGGTISVASGKPITVPANGIQSVVLSTISAFTQGTVAVTGGVGVVAVLYES